MVLSTGHTLHCQHPCVSCLQLSQPSSAVALTDHICPTQHAVKWHAKYVKTTNPDVKSLSLDHLTSVFLVFFFMSASSVSHFHSFPFLLWTQFGGNWEASPFFPPSHALSITSERNGGPAELCPALSCLSNQRATCEPTGALDTERQNGVKKLWQPVVLTKGQPALRPPHLVTLSGDRPEPLLPYVKRKEGHSVLL